MGLSWLLVIALCLPCVAFAQTPRSPRSAATAASWKVGHSAPVPLSRFYALLDGDASRIDGSLADIAEHWSNAFAIMLVELVGLVPSDRARRGIISLLERSTGNAFGTDLDKWLEWIWRTNPGTHPDYAEFKAALYGAIDPQFAHYFDDAPKAAIRLDEIRWGGVLRDGIPPLDHPKMLTAGEATYLNDDNVVFAIELNGDARAYPKRILAWHEMVRDRIGGEELNGVYCTLCGSMIFYRVTINSVHHVLGTSGFLYRSNKLMYDHATESLWSTLTGKPVVGPLVGKGIELEPLFVVTTTWGEWRSQHPDTKVLSLHTGYDRDYSEGAAYREYFATDELMFSVPKLDERLANKAEVLALRFHQTPNEQLAISADLLKHHPVYQANVGKALIVVLTDHAGANRVYESAGRTFVSWDGKSTATDAEGGSWSVSEAGLTHRGGTVLKRLPAHRAFWFGWYAAYPDTRLIK